jgi:hypothetical protein
MRPFALALIFAAWCLFAPALGAQEPRYNNIDPRAYAGGVRSPYDPRLSGDVPAEFRELFRNPDGSCVQCSIGMCGIAANNPRAYTLLVDSEFGEKVRGGSWPERVEKYAAARGIKCWNITGNETLAAMAWACDSGRCAAIGFKTSHFCTLLGSRANASGGRIWWVCDNNSPEKVDQYDDAEFQRLHAASGPWCVILDAPPAPVRPRFVPWWQ